MSTFSDPVVAIVTSSVSEQPARQAEGGGGEPEAERPPQADGGEGADHEHVAVREVDQLDDAVDERVADRDQRPDRAVGQSLGEVEAQLGQVVMDYRVTRHHASLVAAAQVVDAVVDGQRGEGRDEEPLTGAPRRGQRPGARPELAETAKQVGRRRPAGLLSCSPCPTLKK